MSNSNQKLSRSQQESILALLENGHSFRETGRILGLHHSTVQRYAAENTIDMKDPKADAVTRLGRQVARLTEANRRINAENKKIKERGFGYDDFLDAFKELIAVEKKNPFTYYPSKFAEIKSAGKSPAIDPKHEEIACLALSDWHISETVSLRDSNGINVYNSIIGSNRLWHIVQRFKQVLTIHQSAFKIRQISLAFLGDMLSGTVHEEFATSNDLTDQAAVLLTSRLMIMVLQELLPLGIPIRVDSVVGNHPRTTPKVPTKGIAHSNLDWLCYEFVKMWFDGNKQIDFHNHTSQFAIVEHFDHRYLYEHGIEWKNGREEDFESSLRDILDDRVYRQATGLQGTAFDQVLIGNLHKPAFLERTIKNGSLIGQNELGQQWRLKPIRAQQLCWGISPSHDRTWQYGLDATHIKSAKPENPFSEFATEFSKDHGRYETL